MSSPRPVAVAREDYRTSLHSSPQANNRGELNHQGSRTPIRPAGPSLPRTLLVDWNPGARLELQNRAAGDLPRLERVARFVDLFDLEALGYERVEVEFAFGVPAQEHREVAIGPAAAANAADVLLLV